MSKCRVTVYRPSALWGAARKLVVWVDGEKIGSVAVGKSAAFEVELGLRGFQVSMDWCKSPPLLIELTEDTEFAIEVELAPLIPALLYVFVDPSKVFRLVARNAVPSQRT